jgi:hypothetical protein
LAESEVLIPEPYREIEKTKGRSLQEIHSGGVAFTRHDILEALGCLKGTHAGVFGGDVLRVVDGQLRYTYDSWHADKRPGEDIWKYLARSIAEAETYIQKYPDPEDGTILYSPVISELGI